MTHVILICFNNPEQTLLRWQRDVLPGLELTGRNFCATIVDNSPTESELLKRHFGNNYLWNEGQNLMYGGAINLAVPRHPEARHCLYVCSRHGKMLNREWVNDILAPLIADETVGMTGFLMGSNSPEGVAHATHQEWVKEKFHFVDKEGHGYVPQHIQGGVFAARTDLMLRFPYPPGILHLYSDHVLTWEILKAGYKCVTVPTIVSVWRNVVPADKLNDIRYVHDCSEGA